MSRQVQYKKLEIKNGDKMMNGDTLNYELLKST